MENKIKKKIALMVNEPLKNELENSAKVVLEKINIVQKMSKENLKIDLSNTDVATSFIKNYKNEKDIEKTELQNELLFILFDKEVSKLMEDYPSLIKTKALEMFCNPTDRENAKAVISYCVSINKTLDKTSVQNIEFEHLVLNDEFVYNSKIDTRLKESYTTYCQSKKQIELKELAEKLSEIVNHAVKFGLISDNALGINIENIIDINTGFVKYNRIASY